MTYLAVVCSLQLSLRLLSHLKSFKRSSGLEKDNSQNSRCNFKF